MVLNSEILRNNPKVLADNHFNYMVLDVSHVVDSEMYDRFEYSLNITNARNAFEMINQLWKDLGVKRELDVSIFNPITDAIYSEEPFTDKQLKHYFSVMKEFEETLTAFRSFNASLDNVFIQDRIEMVLMGVSLKTQENNSKKLEAHEGVGDRFGSAKYNYYNGKIDYKTFLSLTKDIFKELEEPGEKAA